MAAGHHVEIVAFTVDPAGAGPARMRRALDNPTQLSDGALLAAVRAAAQEA